MSIFKKIFNKKKILVTHGGTFHVDDLFSTASLSILNEGRVKIIRIKDTDIVEKADYVYDIGKIYNPQKGLFDHHQKGGPVRDDGIPYSAFGLIWKEYGELICGSKEVADRIEKRIVVPIDAEDNGVDIYKNIFDNVYPYVAGDVFKSEAPTWKEDFKTIDRIFKRELKKIIQLLKREIKVAQDDIEGIKIILESYSESQDKRIVILSRNLPRYLYQETLSYLTEPIYIILPDASRNKWKVESIRKNSSTKESRKPFPESWRGEVDIEKLKDISGVSDITFCHRNGFLIGSGSKEGAIALAQKALIA